MTKSDYTKDGDATVLPFLVTVCVLRTDKSRKRGPRERRVGVIGPKGKLKVCCERRTRRGFCFSHWFFRDRLHTSARKWGTPFRVPVPRRSLPAPRSCIPASQLLCMNISALWPVADLRITRKHSSLSPQPHSVTGLHDHRCRRRQSHGWLPRARAPVLRSVSQHGSW